MRSLLAILAVGAVSLAVFTSCRQETSRRDASRTPPGVAQLRVAYPDGVTLPRAGFTEFTLQTQRRLHALVGETIICSVSLIDLVERDGVVYLHGVHREYDFSLRVCDDLLAQFLSPEGESRFNPWRSFAVAFRLTDVKAPVVTLRSEITRIEEGSSGNIVLDYSGSPILFGDLLECRLNQGG